MYNKKCGFDREFEMNRARRERSMKPMSWITEKNRKLSEMGRMLGRERGSGREEERKEEGEKRDSNGVSESAKKRADSGCKILVETPNPRLKELQ